MNIKPGTYWFCHIMFFLSLIFSSGASGVQLRVSLVLSNDSAPYQTFSNTFRRSLPASVQAEVLPNSGAQASYLVATDIIVAVGMRATEIATQQTTYPVLSVMVPQSGYETLLAGLPAQKRAQNLSAIYLNQPWDRQVHFLFAVLPGRKKVGVLYSSGMQQDLSRLRAELVDHGGSLLAQAVNSDAMLAEELDKVLEGCDVLLAVPDSTIYSSSNVRNILLSTYRRNVPLIGLSQAYVNAGAVAAMFSTPEQLAEQAASTVAILAQTGSWPNSQYPTAFSIALNQQVARSLGIELPSDAEIRTRMRKNRRNAND